MQDAVKHLIKDRPLSDMHVNSRLPAPETKTNIIGYNMGIE